MRINPINTNYNINHRATIKPSKPLHEGFDMLENYVDSGCMKNLNSIKEFIDSIAKIRESKKVKEFKVVIDKKDTELNLTDAYLAVENTNNFASNLEKIKPSVLDDLKAEIEAKTTELDLLIERYGQRLKAELNQAKKIIFDNAE